MFELHKFFFGTLGLSEYEYYTNSPYTNFCKIKGYEDKSESYAQMLRVGFYRIHQSLVQKPLPIKEFWPLPSDSRKLQKDTIVISREMLAAIKKAHNLK